MSEGTFTITIADTIEGEDRENAQEAAEFVRDSLILRNMIWLLDPDTSQDHVLEDYYTFQALDKILSVQDGMRENRWTYRGWLSGTILVKSSYRKVSVVEVCHDFTEMSLLDEAGEHLKLPDGQNGTYGVDPLPEGIRITTLRYETDKLRPC